MIKNTVRKVALVTGGSRGLGKDMAISLAKIGIDVVLTYNTNKQEGDKVVDTIRGLGCKAAVMQLDVSQIASFDMFLKQLKIVLRENWKGLIF
jgi:NAD(P)-dependent dehydrogenase (short-subunit alcohol dehydrogenase family)